MSRANAQVSRHGDHAGHELVCTVLRCAAENDPEHHAEPGWHRGAIRCVTCHEWAYPIGEPKPVASSRRPRRAADPQPDQLELW